MEDCNREEGVSVELYEKALAVAGRMCKYFNGHLIGSVLLVEHIGAELISDIDVAVPKETYFNVMHYLLDLGFRETTSGRRQSGYADIIGSCVFRRDGFLDIHLCLVCKDFRVKGLGAIWADKIKRYSVEDQKHIQALLSNHTTKPWSI
jgi:hypothetical protein